MGPDILHLLFHLIPFSNSFLREAQTVFQKQPPRNSWYGNHLDLPVLVVQLFRRILPSTYPSYPIETKQQRLALEGIYPQRHILLSIQIISLQLNNQSERVISLVATSAIFSHSTIPKQYSPLILRFSILLHSSPLAILRFSIPSLLLSFHTSRLFPLESKASYHVC